MKIMKHRPNTLWQAVFVFLILLDAIFLFLTVIANLRLSSVYDIGTFDLIVSIVLLVGYLWSLERSSERSNFIKNNWTLIISFVPIYFIAFYTGLIVYLIPLKILNLIKILSLYLYAQKFAREVIKYQQQTRLVYALAFFLVVFFLCSFIFYTVEHGVNPEVSTYEDSLWFVLQTITTVGYGDIIPVTGIGRLMGVVAMFSAIILTSILTSAATFSLIEKFTKRTDYIAGRTREYVEKIDGKLDGISGRLDDLDSSKDIKDMKDDLRVMKSEMDDLKEIIQNKK